MVSTLTFSFIKVAYTYQQATFLSCMCFMNATSKKSIYSLVDEFQCHNKWKLMCVCLCNYLSLCVGKLEGKLEIIRPKVKTYRKHLWYWDKVMCKWVFLQNIWCVSEFFFKIFSFKCWRNKFTAFLFQTIRKKIDFLVI